MSRFLWTSLLALVVSLPTTPTALAADVEEVFRDAARVGKLTLDDVEILDTEGPECHLWSPKTQTLFCVTLHREDAGERREAVFVDLRSGETLSHGLPGQDRGATAAALKTVNRRLRSGRWDDVWPALYDTAPFSKPSGGKLVRGRRWEVRGDTASLHGRGGPIAAAPLKGFTLVYAPEGAHTLLIADDGPEGRGAIYRYRVLGAPTDASVRPAPPKPSPGPSRAPRCPADVWCPPGWPQLYPLMEALCEDRFDAELIATTESLAEREELAAEDLSVLFNAYGALHGYRFKKKVRFNTLFYGDAEHRDATWLPDACRRAMAAPKDRAALSPAQRKARDAIKRLWRRFK